MSPEMGVTIRWPEWKTRLMTANGRSTKERTLLMARFLRLSFVEMG
jgi:hypothetical protein